MTTHNPRIHYQMTSIRRQRTSHTEQTHCNCLYSPNLWVLCYLTFLSPLWWYKFWSNLKSKNLRVNLISRKNWVLGWSSKDHSCNRNTNICTCKLRPTAYRNTTKWRTQKWREFRFVSSSGFTFTNASFIISITRPQNFHLPKRALHIVRSRASSFKWQYPLLSLRSSSSFLCLLPRLPVIFIPPFIFHSIILNRSQFLRKMWPIQFAFRLLISCRIFLCSLTLSNTS
jgi:hypothetical protein